MLAKRNSYTGKDGSNKQQNGYAYPNHPESGSTKFWRLNSFTKPWGRFVRP